MASLNKVRPLSIRMTPDQRKRVSAAAGIVSRQRKMNVTESALVRELVLPEVDRIIAEAGARKADHPDEEADQAA